MLTQGHALLSYLALRPTFTTTFWLAPLLGGIVADMPWIFFCVYHWWSQTDADAILSSYYEDQWQTVWGYSHSFVLSIAMVVAMGCAYCVARKLRQDKESKRQDRELFRDPLPCNIDAFDIDMVVIETDRRGRPVTRLNFDDVDDIGSESTGIFTDNGKERRQREKANGRRSHHSSISRASPVATPPLSSSCSFSDDANVPLRSDLPSDLEENDKEGFSHGPNLMSSYIASHSAPFGRWNSKPETSSLTRLAKPCEQTWQVTDPLWSTEWLFWFAIAWFLHCAGDFPVHCDDAHSQFLPFTTWKWHSPVSFWNVRHYAAIIAPLETLLVITSCVWCFRRSASALFRTLIVVLALSYACHLTWTLVDYGFWETDYRSTKAE